MGKCTETPRRCCNLVYDVDMNDDEHFEVMFAAVSSAYALRSTPGRVAFSGWTPSTYVEKFQLTQIVGTSRWLGEQNSQVCMQCQSFERGSCATTKVIFWILFIIVLTG